MQEHTDLKDIIINASVVQLLYDQNIAEQRFYKSNIESSIGNVVKYKGDYSGTFTYTTFNIVTYNYKAYMCISASPIVGVVPTDTNSWIQMSIVGPSGSGMSFFTSYDNTYTYTISDCLPYANKLYVSIVNNNLNHQPDISPNYWSPIITVPYQIIISNIQPTGQDSNGYWHQTNSTDNSYKVMQSNGDGTYTQKYPVSKASLIKTTDGSNVQAHIDNKNNPHEVTTAQIGAVPASQKGAAGGVATLNDNGYVMQRVGAGRKSGAPIGANSTAEGFDTIASNECCHAEGRTTQSTGLRSHSEGEMTKATGGESHAEGLRTTASGQCSHAEGEASEASGPYSHAEGVEWGGNLGCNTIASGTASHAEGCYTRANVFASHVSGDSNKDLNGDPSSFQATADAMVIGNGDGAKSNCFRITFDGKVYGLSAFNSSGADYSEFFEWADENPSAEDRVGHFVTLDGEKIKLANDGDYIVGITSGNPAVVGDHPSESWNSRYLRDAFGRLQYEDVVIPAQEEKDKEGNVIRTVPEHTETHFKVNPDYDPAKETEYENREKRPEWATVGLMGKLVVIDDGTCEVNGYCKPADGIATKADTGYRVLARLDETHIKVLMK